LINDALLGTFGGDIFTLTYFVLTLYSSQQGTFDKDGKITINDVEGYKRFHGRDPETGVKKWF